LDSTLDAGASDGSYQVGASWWHLG